MSLRLTLSRADAGDAPCVFLEQGTEDSHTPHVLRWYIDDNCTYHLLSCLTSSRQTLKASAHIYMLFLIAPRKRPTHSAIYMHGVT